MMCWLIPLRFEGGWSVNAASRIVAPVIFEQSHSLLQSNPPQPQTRRFATILWVQKADLS